MKIVSWNLYYKSGATLEHVSTIIEQEQPDILLMQEATPGIDDIISKAGGDYSRQAWHGKSYGLAAWVAKGQIDSGLMPLPRSPVPSIFPRRAAQVLDMGSFRIVNVHLSHGQVLNRRQLATIAKNVPGPLAIMGDFNIFGPAKIRGLRDVGPRYSTHRVQKVVPLRLDRCLVRELGCRDSKVLEQGRSDHRPIMLELDI